MEYLKGGNLRKLINDNVFMTDDEISKVIFCICNSLIELNLKNISHNDLKPENILLVNEND